MEERSFAKNGSIEENRNEYGVKNMFRYADQFTISEKEAIALFASIPFLNGGLFDCLDKPDDSGKILYSDGFSRNPKKRAVVPDYLFYGNEQECDLNEIYGTRNKRYPVKGLIETLSNYKFTIAENTPLEEEVALDPELLGKVFENLLASYNPETQTTARKQTGSFYTPREIVDYMVDESLIAYFKSVLLGKSSVFLEIGRAQTSMFGNEVRTGQLALTDKVSGSQWQGKENELESQLRNLLSYSTETHSFGNYDIDVLISAIDSCKILDPACGSGAFPMGILHKLVLVLHKLDPKNEKWKKRQIHKIKQVEDPVQREKIIEGIEDAFLNNELDYGRKLFLIENCIYGVDIQPIAVQIAKLRFFISLIIDQNKRSGKDNLGIKSLPNLETKFVAADTLIGLQQQGVLRNVEIEELEAELKRIRHDYFSARTRKDKLAFQKKDKQLRQNIAQLLQQSGWDGATALQVARFDPYDQNKSADFFDFEWMFGLKSAVGSIGIFDIVIGNPPYIQIQNFSGMKQQKDWEKQKFATYVKTGDVYCLFYERGYQLLRNGGVLTYITSNKWMRANYGKVIRKFFADITNPVKLVDFENFSVFEATVNTNILMVAKGKNTQQLHAVSVKEDFKETTKIADYMVENGVILKNLGEDSWLVSSNEEFEVKKKIEKAGTPLKDWDIKLYRGIISGLNDAFIIEGKKKDELIANDPKSAEIIKPIIRGRDIKRYRYDKPDLWIILATFGSYKFMKKSYPAIYKHLHEFKDALEERGQCRYSSSGRINTDRDYPGQHHWLELDNNPREDFIKEFDKYKITWGNLCISSQFALCEPGITVSAPSPIITPGNKYLLAVLNSKLGDYYIRSLGVTRSGGYFEYKPMFVENLPVPQIPDEQQTPYTTLVDCILFCKDKNMEPESSLLESVIDGLVFDLYFPQELKAAHCYITDRIASVLKPFRKSDTLAFKTEYIKTLEKFLNKDETISHSLVHRHLIKPIQIILGGNK